MAVSSSRKNRLEQGLRRRLTQRLRRHEANLSWLQANMNPYFFLTMKDHPEVIDQLVAGLDTLGLNRHLLLADRFDLLIRVGLSAAGSIYKTLAELQDKPIYAEITHSYGSLPGSEAVLEVQRYEFRQVSSREVRAA
ncbi:MAG: amino acid dehydrogenase, partial [Desulfuromonadales bacterium]|nr:amino acid dehydrogenase [Desulfuromonadales bacterium]